MCQSRQVYPLPGKVMFNLSQSLDELGRLAFFKSQDLESPSRILDCSETLSEVLMLWQIGVWQV